MGWENLLERGAPALPTPPPPALPSPAARTHRRPESRRTRTKPPRAAELERPHARTHASRGTPPPRFRARTRGRPRDSVLLAVLACASVYRPVQDRCATMCHGCGVGARPHLSAGEGFWGAEWGGPKKHTAPYLTTLNNTVTHYGIHQSLQTLCPAQPSLHPNRAHVRHRHPVPDATSLDNAPQAQQEAGGLSPPLASRKAPTSLPRRQRRSDGQEA